MPIETETSLSPFQQELARELVKSERFRVAILATVVVVGACTSFVVTGLGIGLVHDPEAPTKILLVAVPATAYFLLVRWELTRLLQVGQIPKPHKRYATATFEAMIPTCIILIQLGELGPVMALGLPMTYVYFLIIATATLHLSFWLCLYTSAACATMYLLVVLLVIDRQLPGGVANPSPLNFWVAAFMLATGVISGLVARRVKTGIENSIHVVESRRRILETFGQHVSPQVVEYLLKSDVPEAGERRHVCVMFLDIRGFTAYSSHKQPEEVVAFLNGLLDSMIDSINRHHGIVNKFLGDGFMAIFGAPVSQGRDCQNAVAAAREMLDRLALTSNVQIGIALHYGEVVAGTVGSPERREYTIIGDTVNLASRIESLNKEFGSRLLVSDSVWHELAGEVPEVKCHGAVAIRGKDEPVIIHQLM